MNSATPTDITGLARELARQVRGEVRFDAGTRALYATDASNYRQVPIGVVVPRDVDDVAATIDACRRFGAPVLPRGGGTSLAGQCCNVAVVIDMSQYMSAILDIDLEVGRARVQPGIVLDTLRDAAEEGHLTFGPDPSTHSRCTLGGMIGNNACGVHSVMAGKTEENVEALDILLYDGLRLRVGATTDDELAQIIAAGGRRGDIYARLRSLRDRYALLIRARYPNIPRRVSGYNLDQLLPECGFHVARALVGSEGTCATVLEATVRLVHSPPAKSLLVLGYTDIYRAAEAVPALLELGPIGLEGLDNVLVESMAKKGLHPRGAEQLPPGKGWLLAEFGGETDDEAVKRAEAAAHELQRASDPPAVKLFKDAHTARIIWRVRESGLGATARVPGERDSWEGWEDAAVPPDRLGPYLRDFRALLSRFGYSGALYGHFGQGCVHTRINFDLETDEGVARFRTFLNEAADLVVSYGGSLSGEHGDGQARAQLLPKMFGAELVEAFREFKRIWDPENRMNPGKVVDAFAPDENLRLGPGHSPVKVQTHFRFPGDDRGSFARATLRCVGVGECRRLHEGTMCPSYMVTREEKHSTRGRARLLYEMLQGDVIREGWRSEAVREALDLCLACKACKGECPVNVDMATYKAEFLSHYYEGRIRPRQAYAFGLIPRWSRLASLAPSIVNRVTQSHTFAGIAKTLAGVAPQRRIPLFARRTFRRDFRRRARAGERVVLWPDTFNDHFHPQTLQAAVTVLEHAGYAVDVPSAWLCCGRPLYDYGMLDTAKRWLRRILRVMGPDIERGTPIVVLEPSCATVFRDELIGLFPDDAAATRLSQQVFDLGTFLARRAPAFRVPPLAGHAVVHGHCHHKAVLRMDDEVAVLEQAGLDLEVLDAGCCGMAGAFGFEEEHYDIAMRCGERVLLPAVRRAPADALIIADGFSCREQITQGAGRNASHLAEVLAMAIAGDATPTTSLPNDH